MENTWKWLSEKYWKIHESDWVKNIGKYMKVTEWTILENKCLSISVKHENKSKKMSGLFEFISI